MSLTGTLEVRCPRCGRFVLEGLFEALRIRHCGGSFIAQSTSSGLVVRAIEEPGALPSRARPC